VIFASVPVSALKLDQALQTPRSIPPLTDTLLANTVSVALAIRDGTNPATSGLAPPRVRSNPISAKDELFTANDVEEPKFVPVFSDEI
jgi:hypothetical protein